MRNLTIIFPVIILLLGLQMSCSEENIQGENVAPFVNAKFINRDSLIKVNAQITSINQSLNAIDTRIKEIDADANRLALQDEKDSLVVAISDLEKDKSEWVKVRSTINSGKLNVSSITGSGSEKTIINNINDSVTSYDLPLNASANYSRIFTIIDNKKDTIDFTYEIKKEFIENELRASALYLEAPFFTFDSVKINCIDTLCLSNYAEITIYF